MFTLYRPTRPPARPSARSRFPHCAHHPSARPFCRPIGRPIKSVSDTPAASACKAARSAVIRSTASPATGRRVTPGSDRRSVETFRVGRTIRYATRVRSPPRQRDATRRSRPAIRRTRDRPAGQPTQLERHANDMRSLFKPTQRGAALCRAAQHCAARRGAARRGARLRRRQAKHDYFLGEWRQDRSVSIIVRRASRPVRAVLGRRGRAARCFVARVWVDGRRRAAGAVVATRRTG